ncbi:Aldo/keto reductase [Phlegmacium glaucopus]|nr:Aldo/keto reductase [Phlegmacium glaucopus]
MYVELPKIGNNDVSEIGFGLMGLPLSYYPIESDEEGIKEGCTFWDTADAYGHNEELLGKWSVFLSSQHKNFLTAGKTKISCQPRFERAKPSLKKLGADFVDLFYLHVSDRQVPIGEKSVGAMSERVKEGTVQYLGLAEVSPDTLSCICFEYSLFCLEMESEKIRLLRACQELGVALIPYAPLGRGILTGIYKSHDDFPRGDIRRKYSKDNFPNILKLVDGIQEVAKKRGVKLPWLLAQVNNIVPVPGTRKRKSKIREKAEKASSILGPRYPPHLLELSFADTPPQKWLADYCQVWKYLSYIGEGPSYEVGSWQVSW